MKNKMYPVAWVLVAGLLMSCGRQAPSSNAEQAASSGGSTAPLPGLADLPECPGWLATQDARGDASDGSGRLLSSQPVAAITDFYTEQLAAGGWLLGATVQHGQERHLQFSQAGRSLRMQIGPAKERDAQTSVFLAWHRPKGIPLMDESYEPDFVEDEIDEVSRSSIEW